LQWAFVFPADSAGVTAVVRWKAAHLLMLVAQLLAEVAVRVAAVFITYQLERNLCTTLTHGTHWDCSADVAWWGLLIGWSSKHDGTQNRKMYVHVMRVQYANIDITENDLEAETVRFARKLEISRSFHCRASSRAHMSAVSVPQSTDNLVHQIRKETNVSVVMFAFGLICHALFFDVSFIWNSVFLLMFLLVSVLFAYNFVSRFDYHSDYWVCLHLDAAPPLHHVNRLASKILLTIAAPLSTCLQFWKSIGTNSALQWMLMFSHILTSMRWCQLWPFGFQTCTQSCAVVLMLHAVL
jgi:hypothetical protein